MECRSWISITRKDIYNAWQVKVNLKKKDSKGAHFARRLN